MLTLVIGNKNYSSWSLRAWLLLRQAGIAFEEIRLPLDTPEFSARIGSYSPTGRVPVLLTELGPVWDTLAIAEYLAESFPDRQLWPADRKLRATARSLSAEMHSGFPLIRSLLPMNCRALDRRVKVNDSLQMEIDRVTGLWRDCLVADGGIEPWLFGAFSIADAMYAPVVSRFVTYGIRLESQAGEYVSAVMDSRGMREWCEAAARESEVLSYEETGLKSGD